MHLRAVPTRTGMGWKLIDDFGQDVVRIKVSDDGAVEAYMDEDTARAVEKASRLVTVIRGVVG